MKELALAGITTVEAANRFIAEAYLPAHNARFAVAAERPAPPSSPARPRPGATSSAGARPARSATTTP